MDVKSFEDIKLFTQELQKLAHADKREWQGFAAASGMPASTANIMQLLNKNQHLINRYAGIDPDLNESLIILADKMLDFFRN